MATVISHIHLDSNQVAWIDDTNVKVIEVAVEKLAWGWNADEIHANHPHLTLAQIHAALSYYYDHQAEIDAEIQRRLREMDELAASFGPWLSRKELEARLPRS
jgi:uncharacterized protein (DUF433 family)